MATICIFEDDAYPQFFPLTYTRPVYDLVCGMTSLRDKILQKYTGLDVALHCRPQLAPMLKREHPGFLINSIPRSDCLFINGRLFPDKDLADRIPIVGEEVCYVVGDTLVAARLSQEKVCDVDLETPLSVESFLTEKRIDIDVDLMNYPWELLDKNTEWLRKEYQALNRPSRVEGTVFRNVSCINEESLSIGKNAQVKPGVVLDAASGPIYIGDEATIQPNAVIQGPVYIGKGTQIKAGARLSGGTTIGPMCKIGGEVEGSIIIGYSNKQHDGYLGHSYIGTWVNLGAGTTNSDLKNNYRPVKVSMNGRVIDTGSLFVGVLMGDHSKTGINTMLNTGTVVGVSCNVFGADFPPKYIPSFSWSNSGKLEVYDLEKAIETARRVTARRERILSDEEEAVLRFVYHTTLEQRERARTV
jgi:UDP-N-acetylglucosamine diphosphorylase/glucosamine-1-phosphate N-acetyltransferase